MKRNRIFLFFLLFYVFIFPACKNSFEQEQSLTQVNFQIISELSNNKGSQMELSIHPIKNTNLTSGRIKIIGGFSRNFPKKSYLISLDSPISIEGLPEHNRWIFNSSYIDKTFMRHRLSFDLFNQMSMSNIAPQSAYIDLFVNGVYEGIYIVMEHINADLLELDDKDPNSFLCIECPVFREDFLINDSIAYEVSFDGTMNDKMAMDHLQEFYEFILSSTDEEFSSNIEKWVDLDEFIDWHLLLLFTNNSDGILKNFGLYKSDSISPFKIAIWDYDHSFGRDGDNEMNMLQRNVNIKRSILFNRLLSHPFLDYSSQLIDRFATLRDSGAWTLELLSDDMNKLEMAFKNSLARNEDKWPVDGSWYHDSNTFIQEKEIMEIFIDKNLKRLDSMLLKKPR